MLVELCFGLLVSIASSILVYTKIQQEREYLFQGIGGKFSYKTGIISRVNLN